MPNLVFKLNENLYLKDPQHTELGQNILKKSIDLIDRLGIEQFTFKKLAEEINSTEASIYRYFENKHRLLLYLINWYWSWLEYRIDLFTSSVEDPAVKLKCAIKIIAEEKKFDPSFEFVNEEALFRIVMAELDKTYLTKSVDDDNRIGFFSGYKSLCKKIADWILRINPEYPYSRSLVSTLLLTAKQQIFFSEHLPSLTNISKDANQYTALESFLENMVFNSITLKNHQHA